METRIKFGSSTSPCRMSHDDDVKEQLLEAKENGDPDEILQCPFDKNHQIRHCRFPYHILKCRKNHPKLAEELKACPFNARHLIPKQELAHHVEICENRTDPTKSEGKDKNCAWHVPVVARENSCKTEDWDMEAEDHAVPFVWGANPQLNEQPINNLPPRFEAPNGLPWASFRQ
uniref:Zgc:56699 n=1 Tax=Oryzias latipes TaxID=8090 RepID=A0A3P9H9G7_ORYLA